MPISEQRGDRNCGGEVQVGQKVRSLFSPNA
jgi:hypothetical protein